METKIRILLADANADFRSSMTDLVSREGDMEIVAAVDNGADALALVSELKPDILLTDLVLLKLDGLERHLKQFVILISMRLLRGLRRLPEITEV